MPDQVNEPKNQCGGKGAAAHEQPWQGKAAPARFLAQANTQEDEDKANCHLARIWGFDSRHTLGAQEKVDGQRREGERCGKQKH